MRLFIIVIKLANGWKVDNENVVWVEQGKIFLKIGKSFSFVVNSNKCQRFNYCNLQNLLMIDFKIFLQSKSPGIKYQSGNYVPIMSRGGGSHSGGPFAANRAIPSVQVSVS